MPNLTYNRDTPDSPNNPSVDQSPMKVNTNSTDDLINVDHFSFNDNNGGYHKQTTFVQNNTAGGPAVPAGTGLLFGGPNGGNTWPHWSNAITGITPILMLNGIPSAVALGYTYLAGGVLMNWGRTTTSGTTTAVTFGKAFAAASTPFSIVLTVERNTTNVDVAYVLPASPSNTGFTIERTFSSNLVVNWIAIGLA